MRNGQDLDILFYGGGGTISGSAQVWLMMTPGGPGIEHGALIYKECAPAL